ncbi:MAG: tetrahydrofolate dehydrogenase/cyclohydrolase catalytic domain-containing protein [Adlercreutzia sp.]
MARILYGKEVSSALWERLLPRIDRLRRTAWRRRSPLCAGERPDDLSYERTCARQADLHGIAVRRFVLPADATQAELEAVIDLVNADARIHGCLMFRPLPASMNERAVCDRLTPVKDIDGIGSASLAGVFADTGEGFPPATAQACLETLGFYDIPVAGKRVVVLGRSLVIGRPVAMMLLARHATVTLAHSRTADVAAHTAGRHRRVRHRPRPRPLSRVLLARPDGARCGHQLRCRRQSRGDVDFGAVSPCGSPKAPSRRCPGIGGVTTSVTMAHVVQAAEAGQR